MSVTSATDTFTDGAEFFGQEKYWSTVSTSIEPDPIQMEEEFKRPLSERISPLHSHHSAIRGEYRLDDVIVNCTTDAYRNHQKNQWNAVKAEAEQKKWSWNATLIGSGIIAAIGGILMTMGPAEVAKYLWEPVANFASIAAPFLLVAGVIGAIASICLATSANNSISQANQQIHGWDTHPVLTIGRERDEAHKQGFPYIYAHNLKLGKEPSYTGRFHPKQVEHEYKKYFEAFCKKLLDQSCNTCKASWMYHFRSSNPIARELMAYGLGHVPEHMKPVIEDYTRFDSFLSDISKSYDTLKSDVRASAKERIEGHHKTRNEQLQPYAQARDSAIATAKAERDRIFERHPLSTDRHHQDAKDNYEAIKKALENDYTVRAGPINRKCDSKIKEIEKERDERIRKLDDQKGHQLANNYNAAHELLVRAKQAWDNQGYQPVNFQQYFPYQNSQPAYYPPQPVYYQQPSPQPVHPQYNQGYGQPAYPAQQPVYYAAPSVLQA